MTMLCVEYSLFLNLIQTSSALGDRKPINQIILFIACKIELDLGAFLAGGPLGNRD